MRRKFSFYFRRQGLNGFLDDQASLGKTYFKPFTNFGLHPPENKINFYSWPDSPPYLKFSFQSLILNRSTYMSLVMYNVF